MFVTILSFILVGNLQATKNDSFQLSPYGIPASGK